MNNIVKYKKMLIVTGCVFIACFLFFIPYRTQYAFVDIHSGKHMGYEKDFFGRKNKAWEEGMDLDLFIKDKYPLLWSPKNVLTQMDVYNVYGLKIDRSGYRSVGPIYSLRMIIREYCSKSSDQDKIYIYKIFLTEDSDSIARSINENIFQVLESRKGEAAHRPTADESHQSTSTNK